MSVVVFFKQKTAYEMRISDWSSDVCSSDLQMHLAMDNCPNQLVLFGPHEEAAKLHERLRGEGAICQELPFGRAYHTALFKPLADAFRAYFQTLDFGPGTTIVYSASTCAPVRSEEHTSELTSLMRTSYAAF